MSPCRERALAVWLLLTLLIPFQTAAQTGPTAPAAQKRASATRIPRGAIVIDGRLSEKEWATTPAADGFVQQQPREGAPITDEHRSEVRFLYDDEYLYIGATFHEPEPEKLVTNELKRDFAARAGDLYVVVLDTFLDRLNAYNFQTNPGCALRDSQSYDDGRSINANWDAVWVCRSTVEGTVWYVEEAIPFKQLRFPRRDDQVWGLQIFRLIRHTNEQTVWSPTPRQFNQFKTSYEGLLEGISGVSPGRNIRVKPFVTGTTRQTPGRNQSDADGGLDVKVGLGTNLVLDGTWRTDFSQVETDAQQINLTRFSLFFPEKREFFLENQGAFQIGPPATSASNLVPFFSRTIGLSDSGTPIPIVGGLRLTGKVGRTSIALLNMQTEGEHRPNAASLPSANYSVFRVGREFLSNSSAGVFYLDKERGGTSNRLVGADLRFYPTRAWTVDGMFMHSDKTGIGGGDAWRGGAQFDSGLTQVGASMTSLGDSFRDELGFIPRQGVDIITANALRRIRPASLAPTVREIRPQLTYARYTRDALNPATGGEIGVETATTMPGLSVDFFDGAGADYTFTRNEELLTAPFRPQGMPAGRFIPAGRYRFNSQAVSYDSSNAQKVSFNGAWRFGDFYNGARKGFTATSRLRVNEKLAATLSITRDMIELPGGTSFDTNLSSLRVDASFSTRMFLNAFLQYNSVTRQFASNIRYDFIHHPLSDVFIVYNDSRFIDISQPTAAQVPNRALVLKVTHLLSF
ncbi:MAG: DUF5916 domain-containing protein [Vicinamibacterales bacterium]